MSLAGLSIRRPVFIASVVILSILMGLASIRKLGVDLFPEVSFPIVVVQTIYPGASPNDVEVLVSKVIEEELGSLPGLKKLSSQSLESVSVVVAEFKLGADIKEAEQQIRNRVGNVRRELPSEIEEPKYDRVDPSDLPVARIAFKSQMKGTELYDVVKEEVIPIFERIDGIGKVEITGGRKREIQVLLDTAKLQDRELSASRVAMRLGEASKNIPLGKADQGATETVFRSLGEFNSVASIENVVVNLIDRVVPLREVGKVIDGEEKEQTRSTLNGEKALFLDIFKQSGANTVKVVDEATKKLTQVNEYLASKKLPVEAAVVRDGAKEIRNNVFDVYEAIIIGIVLCVIVVFFFLGSFRSTVITGLALPNSLLGAFVLMYLMGFTINIMTLLALSLAVGLLIDDAIVVRENIFRHLEMGKSPAQASLEGTNEVTMAVLATSAVVISVFGPIAFLDGMVGQFFRQFGLTVVFAMIISTFDALTVAPMLSANWASAAIHTKGKGMMQKILDAFDRFQSKLEHIYEKAIRWTLNYRKTVLAIGAASFVASILLMGILPSTFLPAADHGEFSIIVEAPTGSSLEKTAELIAQIESTVKKNSSVELTAGVAGDSKGQANKGGVYVRLLPGKQRKFKTGEVKDQVREALRPLSNVANIRVQDYDPIGGGQRPFMMNVEGQNLDEVSKYVDTIKASFAKIPGLVEIDTNYRSGKPEFQVVFDREKSGLRGVSVAQVGQELRSRIEGVVPAVFRENGREYDIRVKTGENEEDLKANYKKILVANERGNLIPLSSFTTGRDVQGYSQINRMNRARYIEISGDIGSGGALGNIMEAAQKVLAANPPPSGVTWSFQGQAEDFRELIANMLFAIFAAVVLIYLVLASLYNSFITPFTILLALPLAASGAVVALLVTGKGIDIFSLIGIILLLGVVAKNSILLVDYTIKIIEEEGLDRNSALIKACRTRLRPILMTSIALIAGFIPIAVGLNEASSQRTSMGIAAIGGLISSTFLTLLIVPAAYGYIDNVRLWFNRDKAKTSKHSGARIQEHAPAE